MHFQFLPSFRLTLLHAALLAVILSSCSGSAPRPNPTITAEVPAASATPRPSPTLFPTETQRPTPVLPSTETPAAALSMTPTPDQALNEVKLIGLAWYDDYDMLLSFQFPGPVQPEDYTVKLEDKVYTCEVLDQFPDRLYCRGDGAKVLTVANVRVYAAGQALPGFEKEVWVPYFTNNYSDVLQ